MRISRPPTLILAVAEGRQDLGHRDVVRLELVGIDLDLELLGRASPTVDRGDAGDGEQPARNDPVLNGAEIGYAEMLGANYLVTEDLSCRTALLDRRRHISGKARILLKRDGRLRRKRNDSRRHT